MHRLQGHATVIPRCIPKKKGFTSRESGAFTGRIPSAHSGLQRDLSSDVALSVSMGAPAMMLVLTIPMPFLGATERVASMSAAICGLDMKEVPDIALLIRATLARHNSPLGQTSYSGRQHPSARRRALLPVPWSARQLRGRNPMPSRLPASYQRRSVVSHVLPAGRARSFEDRERPWRTRTPIVRHTLVSGLANTLNNC